MLDIIGCFVCSLKSNIFAVGKYDTRRREFVKDAAALWNISERQVSGLCSRGKISGAVKQGRSWMIPTTAEKPADQRVKSGA